MTTYHAPHFDPTVDEIETLKQLEMGEVITLPHALKDHVSGRLLEWGFITKGTGGELAITASGRQWPPVDPATGQLTHRSPSLWCAALMGLYWLG